jgi:HlyD family secretion protein
LEQSPPLGPRPRLLLRGGAVPFRVSPFEGVTLLVIIAIAMFGGYTAYTKWVNPGLNAALPAAPAYIPAFRTNLTSTVSSTGTVQSSQQVTLTFGSTGKIQAFFVALGDQVKTGQVLAKIDDTQLKQALQSAQANLDSAQARLDAATDAPSASDVAAAQQSIASATTQLATAKNNLTTLQSKPALSDVATAQQGVLSAQNQVQTAADNVATAQSTASQAQTAYNNAVSDSGNDFTQLNNAWNDLNIAAGATGCAPTPVGSPSPGVRATTVNSTPPQTCLGVNGTTYSTRATSYNGQVRTYNTDLDSVASKLTTLNNANNALNNGNLQRSIQNAQLGLQTAQQKYLDAVAGPKPDDLDASRKSVDAAQASLTAAQAKYDALFAPPAPDVVAPLVASVEQARTSLETAKKNLADATIVAPFDGRISQLTGEVGSQVGAAVAVFVLLNPNLIRVDANVDQADVGNLKAGLPASVTFDALPGRAYTATVAAIGLTPTIQQGVVTYVVNLSMDTASLAAGTPIPAPGMTGSITVTTSRTDNALVVPARAIRGTARARTVTVKGPDGLDVQKTVTAGTTNGTLTQILTGLTDGDEVLVSVPTAARTSTTPTTGGAGQQFIVPGGGGGIPGR